jgi:prolyl 4-hydroxylase
MELALIADSIFYVRDLISKELCRTLIENYAQDARKHPGFTLGSRGERKAHDEVKVSTDLAIQSEGASAAAHGELHAAVTRVVMSLAAQFPALQVWPLQWSDYKLQHYRKDKGHFKWHFDALGPGAWERQLAMIIYLNSVAEGGETRFHRQQVNVKPVAGDALFFPTFWTHMHCGEVPKSEDKYIISSFVSFAIPPAAGACK